MGSSSGSSIGLICLATTRFGLSLDIAVCVIGCDVEHDKISTDKALEANPKKRRFMTFGPANGELPTTRGQWQDKCLANVHGPDSVARSEHSRGEKVP
jgi:hypothetical protein